jgi:replicative DNA helicase
MSRQSNKLLDHMRLPPHSIEAEQGALSAMMQDPQEVIPIARAKLTTESFYDLRHQEIWSAMLALNEALVPVDLITLSNRMAGNLEACGGLAYLASLQDAAPSASAFKYYADILTEKQMLRGLLKAASQATDAVYTSEGSAESLVATHLSAVEALNKADTTQSLTAKAAVGQVIDRLEAVYGGTLPPSVPTGIPLFDDKAGGLWPQDLVIIAARPSVGKTALMIQIARDSAAAGTPVGIFSAEMSVHALTERSIGGAAGVNTRYVKHWKEPEFRAFHVEAAKFARLPIYMDDTPRITVEKIRAITREWVKKHGVKLITVDYIQLLTTEKRTDSREQEVAHICSTLFLIARENNISVMALAQLNRESEKKGAGAPKMSQMRESGSLEQDAAVVGILYRVDDDEDGGKEARYNSEPFKVFLDIQKNRYGGPFRVPLMFHPKNQRMAEISRIDA